MQHQYHQPSAHHTTQTIYLSGTPGQWQGERIGYPIWLHVVGFLVDRVKNYINLCEKRSNQLFTLVFVGDELVVVTC